MTEFQYFLAGISTVLLVGLFVALMLLDKRRKIHYQEFLEKNIERFGIRCIKCDYLFIGHEKDTTCVICLDLYGK